MSIDQHLPYDYIYINAFNRLSGIGSHKLHLLDRHFDRFADAWSADYSTLVTAGLSASLATQVIEQRKNIDPEIEWGNLQKNNITLITHHDPFFPIQLRDITNPPFCLYVRGDASILHLPSVAIVGSRKISEYGIRATTVFVHDLAHAGINIISGLALGTDITAHRVALANNGITVAILAGGIDDMSIAPRSHVQVARQIIDHGGALISEYPMSTEPTRGTFPARNRIMAGLTNATIIIEAGEKSGTLITATYAAQFKKKIFALPGSIFAPNAFGPNILIRNGIAQPILSSNDVLKMFHKEHKNVIQRAVPEFASKEEKALYELINKHPDGIQINHLIKETSLDTNTISSTLTMLELSEFIKNIGNQTYVVI